MSLSHSPDNEKIQKVLARKGLASRRKVEEWLKEGRISVNGKIAKLGDRITLEDKVFVDGKPVRRLNQQQRSRVLMYHKPTGEVCTRNDPEGRKTIFDHLPRLEGSRWIAVGRLDINTSGLILLTTDGDLANRLMHPRSEIERTYAVRVMGEVELKQIQALTSGVMLDDGIAKFDSVIAAGGEGFNRWYHVSLHEGRNREVRRLWEAIDSKVSRLIRISFAGIPLPPRLKVGKKQELTPEDVKRLRDHVKLERFSSPKRKMHRKR